MMISVGVLRSGGSGWLRAVAAALLGALLIAPGAAGAVQTKFRYAPKVQVFSPPALSGTTGLDWTVSLVAGGAAGGAGDAHGPLPQPFPGAAAAEVHGTFELRSGEELLIYTGALGENSDFRSMPCSLGTCHLALGGVTPGGYGGGGAGGSAVPGGSSGAGGGGATLVWSRFKSDSRRFLMLVAAGGGGDGGPWGPNRNDLKIGHGGVAGRRGTDGPSPGSRDLGGLGGQPPFGSKVGQGGRGGAGDQKGGTTTGVDSGGNPCSVMTCIYYSPEISGTAPYLAAEMGSRYRGGNGGPGFQYLSGSPPAQGGGGGGGGGGLAGGGGGGGGGVFWSGCSYPCSAGAGERTEAGAGAGGAGGSSYIMDSATAASISGTHCCTAFVNVQSVTFVFVHRLSLAQRSFAPATGGGSIARACARGTRVRYNDARAAQTTFTVLRHSGGHMVTVGSFTHGDRAGNDDFQFTGRVAGHALRPGFYELHATPRYHGALGTTVTTAFRIVAGC